MASQLGHISLPLVSLSTTIQQQTAHASIGGNYASGYDHCKRDAWNSKLSATGLLYGRLL
jgi:hypothetical protein